jgi:hypothetical protein
MALLLSRYRSRGNVESIVATDLVLIGVLQ